MIKFHPTMLLVVLSTKKNKKKEKIQHEAARIATGTTRLVSLNVVPGDKIVFSSEKT